MIIPTSSSEKEFFIRDIPNTFSDWDLFRCFLQFGPVDNVRIPVTQNSTTKYGFLTMLTYEGSDEVRKRVMKKKLRISDNVTVSISDVRERGAVTKKSEQRVLAPINQNTTTPLQRVKSSEKFKESPPSNFKIVFRDLPIGVTIDAKVVSSPYPPSEQFAFHIIETNCNNESYEKLQKQILDYCHSNASKIDTDVKIGHFFICCHEGLHHRAQRISNTEAYLIDIGQTVKYDRSMSWPMVERFTDLPALVIPCTISGVNWLKNDVGSYATVRGVLRDWSKHEQYVRVLNTGFRKSLNVVVVNGRTNGYGITDTLIKKKYCVADNRQSSVHTYSRDSLLSFKKLNFENDIHAISENFKDIFIQDPVIS